MSYKRSSSLWDDHEFRNGLRFLVKAILIVIAFVLLLAMCNTWRNDLIQDCKDRGGQVVSNFGINSVQCIEPVSNK